MYCKFYLAIHSNLRFSIIYVLRITLITIYQLSLTILSEFTILRFVLNKFTVAAIWIPLFDTSAFCQHCYQFSHSNHELYLPLFTQYLTLPPVEAVLNTTIPKGNDLSIFVFEVPQLHGLIWYRCYGCNMFEYN